MKTKSANCPMSTLKIDFQSVRRMMIVEGIQIVAYRFPKMQQAEGEKPQAGYARLQNWLKENVSGIYYYQQWGRTLYCILQRPAAIPQYTYEGQVLEAQRLEFQEVLKNHQEPVLNLLLAEYLQSQGKFVSNERFFIYVEPIHRKQFAVAMSLQIRRNWAGGAVGQDRFHYAIVSRVMRFRRVTNQEYKDKWRWKKVPYALDFLDSPHVRLRQLRPSEVQAHEGDLYVLKSNRKNKVSVKFLSLTGQQDFLKSRVGLVGQFIENFVGYLKPKGIDVWQERSDFQLVNLSKSRLLPLMDGFAFQILDCRERRPVPLQTIILQSSVPSLQGAPLHQDVAHLAPELPVLLWMDAAPEYYEKTVGASGTIDDDPYQRFKAQYPTIASQGFNFNPNKNWEGGEAYFEFSQVWTKELMRKLEISLRQLLLKHLILHPKAIAIEGLLANSLEKKVFLSYFPSKQKAEIGRFITFAMEAGRPSLREFDNCILLRNYIQAVTGNEKLLLQWGKMCPADSGLSEEQILAGEALEPYLDLYKKLKTVVFDEAGILKIELPGEYALYDFLPILERFKLREALRPTGDFLPKGDAVIHRELEDFFEEHVHERNISYDQLKRKYLKGANGILEQLFNGANETKYLSLLQKSNGLELPGIKAKLFEIHAGVWFNDYERKYFVGKKQGLNKYEQPYGFPIRSLDVRGFRFEAPEFFEWFDADFVREKEMTVLPLPFTLIRMKKELSS